MTLLATFKGNPMKYVVVFAQSYFGFHSVFSGANYFLHFSPTGVMVHPLATPFFDSMVAIGLYAIVKTVELIVGLCLLLNVFVPFALILEFPISLTIFFLSTIVMNEWPHNLTGAKELSLNLFLCAAYARSYMRITVFRAEQAPIWSKAVRSLAFKPD